MMKDRCSFGIVGHHYVHFDQPNGKIYDKKPNVPYGFNIFRWVEIRT